MRLSIAAALIALPTLAQPAPQPGQPASGVSPTAGPTSPAEGPAGWQGNFDTLWKERDQPGVVAKLHQILSPQLAVDKRSFEANWRLAALYNWEANQVEGDQRKDLAKQAWDAAEIAVEVKPNDVRSQYHCAVGIGQFAEGTGILKALSMGLEGKFRDRIGAALKLDKDYLDGAPQVVWGRFFFKLPWPKRDDNQSIAVLTPLLDTHPHNQRAKFFLAETLTDEGSVDDARKLIQQVLAAPPGDDPPETRLIQGFARKWMAAH